MNLKEYLEDTGMTKATLSRRADISYGVITKLFRGCNISFFSAMALVEASKGNVTPLELLKEIRSYAKPKRGYHKPKT